jgi:hypothetical protein
MGAAVAAGYDNEAQDKIIYNFYIDPISIGTRHYFWSCS